MLSHESTQWLEDWISRIAPSVTSGNPAHFHLEEIPNLRSGHPNASDLIECLRILRSSPAYESLKLQLHVVMLLGETSQIRLNPPGSLAAALAHAQELNEDPAIYLLSRTICHHDLSKEIYFRPLHLPEGRDLSKMGFESVFESSLDWHIDGEDIYESRLVITHEGP